MNRKIVKFLQKQDPELFWTLSALSDSVHTSRKIIRKKLKQIQEEENCFEFKEVMSLSVVEGSRQYRKHLMVKLKTA